MKAKVLTYAKDGNTVVNKYLDITPVAYHENIFTTSPDEYQRVDLVLKFNDTFYCEGNYRATDIENGSEKVIPFYENYLLNVLGMPFIKSIFIELFDALGMDTAVLIERRAQIFAEREADKQRKAAEREKQAEEARLKRESQLKESHLKLIAGEKIDKDDFLELVKLHNIPLHIRTIGMLNDLTSAEIGLNQAHVIGSRAKQVNLDKVFQAAKQLCSAI